MKSEGNEGEVRVRQTGCVFDRLKNTLAPLNNCGVEPSEGSVRIRIVINGFVMASLLGRWTLDVGRRTLDVGRLDVGRLDVGRLDVGRYDRSLYSSEKFQT